MTDPRAAAHGQQAHGVRLEWGPTGADIAIVVDVLSFTTTLCVAVERGMTVYPFAWQDDRAQQYADERDAVLAVGRFEAVSPDAAAVSLSPAHLARVEGVERIVLPSPNGAAISFGLVSERSEEVGGPRGGRGRVYRDPGVSVVGACLRNRSAVARWLEPQVAAGARVAVVAAGERWPDGSLRPGVEDLWGAGAVLAALGGIGDLSPEADHAAASYLAVETRLADRLAACVSGRELVDAGFAEDVTIAAEVDTSDAVPLLDGAAFVALREA